MPFNPFSNDSEDTSFEQGTPITQTAKSAVKATTTQATQQQQALNKSIVDQLYGVTPESPDKAAEHKQQPPGMETIAKQTPQSADDQQQLSETRKKLEALQKMHKENYYEASFGQGAQKRHEQEEAQKKQEKLQEEEEEKQQEEDEKAQKDEELAAMTNRPNQKGRNKMRQPFALTQAVTKTESNRGTTG